MKVQDPIQPVEKSHQILNFLVWFVSIFNPLLQIPQVYQIYTTKSAGDLNLVSWLMMLFNSFVWLGYGIIHKSKPIIFTNICFCTLFTMVVLAIIMWG